MVATELPRQYLFKQPESLLSSKPHPYGHFNSVPLFFLCPKLRLYQWKNESGASKVPNAIGISEVHFFKRPIITPEGLDEAPLYLQVVEPKITTKEESGGIGGPCLMVVGSISLTR